MSSETYDDWAPERALALTSQIVSAYLSNNQVPAEDVPKLIAEVHRAICQLASRDAGAESERLTPAVPIAKSITNDYIVCLEDGKKLKMLKRYLRSSYGLTPDEYRRRWGLPADYPMVAPSYAARRSEFAKKIGLGKNVRRDHDD